MNVPRRLVGVDTGGTFTDMVVLDGAELRVHKVPSTPDNPARAVLAGLAEVVGDQGDDGAPPFDVIHGSTVATNALLERTGSRVALLTTEGFEDVLEIGRQARTAIYDLDVRAQPPLVPAERRFGVAERLGPAGEVIRALTADEAERAVHQLRECDPEAVAICLLHAYANPEHEARLGEAVGERLDVFVSSSHDVLPEFREYERCSTTAVNAYVGPIVSRYLAELGEALGPDRVRIMQSNGGVISLAAAGRFAVQTILSGPAGGAVGGFEIGRRAGYDRVITFDMGGTSTDVGLCPGELIRTGEAVIGEAPIRVPVLDIHTVGAGGGSIAYRDPGGSLRVGPESAGAEPGPICYGHGGDRVTVTDANLFLGRLSPEHFLGGAQELETGAVGGAMAELADELGLDPLALAEGVLRVANETMARAIRVTSLERGHDPRDFTLVCFGGAGGLHAAELARSLAIPRVLIPRAAGALSALGMLMADPIRDLSRTVLLPTDQVGEAELETAFVDLERRARGEMLDEGWTEDRLRFERAADLRYVGQGYEISVPANGELAAAFHEAHQRRYGYADPARPTEVVTVRVRVGVTVEPPRLAPETPGPPDATAAVIGPHRLVYDGETLEALLVDRDRLRPGHELEGPAVIVEYSTTTLVPPAVCCRVDEWNNLVLRWEERPA